MRGWEGGRTLWGGSERRRQCVRFASSRLQQCGRRLDVWSGVEPASRLDVERQVPTDVSVSLTSERPEPDPQSSLDR